MLNADNACELLDGNNVEIMITLINQELHLLYIWLQYNNLSLIFLENLQNTAIDCR